MFLAGHPSQGCFDLQSHCAPCYFFNQASSYPSDFSFKFNDEREEMPICSMMNAQGGWQCQGFVQSNDDKIVFKECPVKCPEYLSAVLLNYCCS
ncbi:hypothetical protein TNCV_795231 [Trichonephila clavipes]|nr:hypothetical protein TNCV_795231 [Trichonephila clavipes]